MAEVEEDRPQDPPAVVDGKLMRLSVSQMQKADVQSGGCLRKWRFSKVEKPIKEAEGAGQKRGKAGHKRIERFLKGEGQHVLEHLELIGLDRGYIPRPGPMLLIEHPIHLPEPTLYADGVPLAGYIDLMIQRGRHPWVKDWKFKKPWDGKLGFDAADLVNPLHEAGIQMIGYAAALLATLRDLERVDLSHVTFQTAGRAHVVQVTASLAANEIAPLWESVVDRIVPRMKVAAAAPHWRDVEPNEKVCDKYGGCAYRTICLDRMARIVAGFRKHAPVSKGSSVGMMSQMLNPAAPPSNPAPQAPSPAPERKLGIQSGGLTQGVIYAPNGVPAKFVCNVDMGGKLYASFAPVAGGPPLMLETADAEKLTAVPPAQQPPIVVPPDAPKSDPALAAKPAPGTLPAAPAAPAAQAAPPPTPEAPKPETPAAQAEAPAKKVRGKKTGDVHLYFGCAPVGESTSSLHSYVENLDSLLQKQAQINMLDLRTANDQVFGFGRWKGFLAKAALETPPSPGHYVVTPGDERIECVANALMPSSHVVIGGR